MERSGIGKISRQGNPSPERAEAKEGNTGPYVDDDFSSTLFSDEIAEAVDFRHFDRVAENQFASIEVALHKRKSLQCITKKARQELLEYVTRIASMYKNVHFHNFEHASHGKYRIVFKRSREKRRACSVCGGINIIYLFIYLVVS